MASSQRRQGGVASGQRLILKTVKDTADNISPQTGESLINLHLVLPDSATFNHSDSSAGRLAEDMRGASGERERVPLRLSPDRSDQG